jgi:type II secretion system protein N
LFSATRVDARVRLIPLISGNVFGELEAELYQGTLAGELGFIDSKYMIDMVAKNLDLSLYPFEGEDWNADVIGLMDLAVDMQVDPEEIKDATGDIELDIDGLIMRSLTLSGFTIDEAVFSEAVLKLDVHDGQAEVKKGSFIADMIEATIDGKITLSSPLERSRLKLTLKLRLEDDLDSLAKLLPGMKSARDEGGTYHFMVSGTVERPRFREDRLAARKRKGATSIPDPSDRATARPPVRTLGGPSGDLDEDAEERKKLREERIAERREQMRKSRDEDFDEDREPGPDRQRGDRPPDFDDELEFDDRRARAPVARDDLDYIEEDRPPLEDLEFEDDPARDLGYAD